MISNEEIGRLITKWEPVGVKYNSFTVPIATSRKAMTKGFDFDTFLVGIKDIGAGYGEDGEVSCKETLIKIKQASPELFNQALNLGSIPRCNFIQGYLRSHPRFANFTPLIPLAFRETIPYSAWDTEANVSDHKSLLICFGLYLANSILMRGLEADEINLEYATRCSKQMKAKSDGIRSSELYPGMETQTSKAFNCGVWARNKIATNHTICQTFLCHPSVRVPGTQILDMFDWDNVPEPLYVESSDVQEVESWLL